MRNIIPLITLALVGISAAACGGTPGAQPHDMSASQHDAMAAKQEGTAEIHSAQYESSASVRTKRCQRPSPTFDDGACWTTDTNPTAEHMEEAKKYRRMADDHLAASQALREAEARACVGILQDDRDMSPFMHREDVANVEPLNVNTLPSARGSYARTVGAVVTFRAVPGLTAQWLQRVVDCHLARNAALGHDVAEMAYCPLVLKGVSAKVSATDAGFAVAIRADDGQTAQEVLRRARALVGR